MIHWWRTQVKAMRLLASDDFELVECDCGHPDCTRFYMRGGGKTMPLSERHYRILKEWRP